LCGYYGKKIKNKKELTKEQKKIIVNWAVRQKQECKNCGTKKHLEIDRIIPGCKGGKYTIGNIQLLCHECNTTIKIGFCSVEDAKKDINERICKACGKLKKLNSNSFHRLSKYKCKFRKNSLSHWHPICKKCRLKLLKKFDCICEECGIRYKAYKQNSKFCSNHCKFANKTKQSHQMIECLCCGKKLIVSKSSKRKYCNNKCSAKNMKRNTVGIFKKKVAK